MRCRAAARYDDRTDRHGVDPARPRRQRRPGAEHTAAGAVGRHRPPARQHRGAAERSRLRRRAVRRGLRPGQLSADLQNLFAFSDPAYQLDGNFNARANGEVFALDTGSDALYVGGGFRTVNGRVTGPLAKLDPATGAVDTGFHPPFTTGAVNQVILKNGVLYVGGTFPGHLLALNPDTGANTGDINFTVSGPIPNAFGPVAIFKFAITNAGDRLVATGNFQQVNTSSRTRVFVADIDTDDRRCQPRRTGLPRLRQALLDHRATADRPAPWGRLVTRRQLLRRGRHRPDLAPRRHLAPPPAVNPANTTVRDGAGRFNMNDDTKPQWINYTGGDSVWATAATGPAVYVQATSSCGTTGTASRAGVCPRGMSAHPARGSRPSTPTRASLSVGTATNRPSRAASPSWSPTTACGCRPTACGSTESRTAGSPFARCEECAKPIGPNSARPNSSRLNTRIIYAEKRYNSPR